MGQAASSALSGTSLGDLSDDLASAADRLGAGAGAEALAQLLGVGGARSQISAETLLSDRNALHWRMATAPGCPDPLIFPLLGAPRGSN